MTYDVKVTIRRLFQIAESNREKGINRSASSFLREWSIENLNCDPHLQSTDIKKDGSGMEQVNALLFKFEDPNAAMVFKLTWL